MTRARLVGLLLDRDLEDFPAAVGRLQLAEDDVVAIAATDVDRGIAP